MQNHMFRPEDVRALAVELAVSVDRGGGADEPPELDIELMCGDVFAWDRR
jgi:hypothetical protein